jgi:hypothetical protein
MGVVAACAVHQDEISFTGWIPLNQCVKKSLTSDHCIRHYILRLEIGIGE